MTARARGPSSGKQAPRATRVWAGEVAELADAVGVQWTADVREQQAGKPAIVRMREVDAEGAATGGTAVLTLYATGAWTWGGDADAVAYCREPLERHGVLR